VGECHFGQRQFSRNTGVDVGGEAVGAADDEDEALGGLGHSLLEPGGHFGGCHFAAFVVQEPDVIRGLEQVQDLFSFTDFLGLGIHVFGVLDVGDDLHLELGKMGQTLGVLADAVDEPFLVRLAYDYE